MEQLVSVTILSARAAAAGEWLHGLPGWVVGRLETAACATLPRSVFTLQIQVTPANQMLAVSFGALMQIDRDTGEVVIVSK